MVGYHEKDPLSTEQKLIAGGISGCITRFVTQPLDFIKLKVQLQKPDKRLKLDPSKSIQLFKETRRILKKDGVTAFFRGHNLGQVHSILAVSTQFYIYELLTKYHAKHFSGYKGISQFIYAMVAGCCSTTLVMPLEVIRVRQMIAKNQYAGLIRGALRVYKTGGILAFYEGLAASLIQMGPSVGISFTVFRYIQGLNLKLLRKYSETAPSAKYNDSTQNVVLASVVAGSLSGLISKTVTYPFDLIKRRMQISTHEDTLEGKDKYLIKCNKVFDCLRMTVQKAGFKGLFTGWKVTVYKAQLTSIVAFTTYETVCHFMRN